MNNKIQKRNVSSRKGATAVEFALVAPILFLLIFASIEFARMMMTVSMIEQSAFEAARHVAVLGATAEEGVAMAENELGFLGIDSATITIEGLSNGSRQSFIDDSTQQISVNIKVPFDDFLFFDTVHGSIEREAVINTERF